MQDAKLKAALEQLREEINQSGLANGHTRTRLNGLISDLESNIGQEPDEQANSWWRRDLAGGRQGNQASPSRFQSID
jgi:hypothetical protein